MPDQFLPCTECLGAIQGQISLTH